MLGALQDDWTAVSRRIVHTDLTKVYDDRHPASRRDYYLVLLNLASILEHNESVDSEQPQLYYKLLLRKQRVALLRFF